MSIAGGGRRHVTEHHIEPGGSQLGQMAFQFSHIAGDHRGVAWQGNRNRFQVDSDQLPIWANRLRGESCVTVINTDPQTSSPGHAWWDVAVAETSDVLTVRQARENYEKHLEAMREQH